MKLTDKDFYLCSYRINLLLSSHNRSNNIVSQFKYKNIYMINVMYDLFNCLPEAENSLANYKGFINHGKSF